MDVLEPLKRLSLVDLILGKLRDDVLAGKYPPGTSLPPERELAARYGVNRTSVKHALMKLEQAGLVYIRQGIGSVVQDYAANGGVHLLEHLLVRAGALDRSLVADLLELRVLMGGVIAQLATEHADETGAAALADVVARMERSLGDPAAVQALDLEFYRVLAVASGNRALVLLLNSIAVAYSSSAAEFVHAFRDTAAVLRGVRSVLAAFQAGDAKRARAIAEKHLRANSEAMLCGWNDGRPATGNARQR
jgi:GntR family transcriptional regulator, transcriptional repressor for pyruvate dehydrogenase complex